MTLRMTLLSMMFSGLELKTPKPNLLSNTNQHSIEPRCIMLDRLQTETLWYQGLTPKLDRQET